MRARAELEGPATDTKALTPATGSVAGGLTVIVASTTDAPSASLGAMQTLRLGAPLRHTGDRRGEVDRGAGGALRRQRNGDRSL